MRRLFVGLAIMTIAALAPMAVRADEQADQQIAQYIVQHLKAQKEAGNLKGFAVDLQVEDGSVFFDGYVASAEQKQLVLGVAQQASDLGVRRIFHNLKVQEAGAAAADDAAASPQASRSSRRNRVAKAEEPAIPENPVRQASERREVATAPQEQVAESRPSEYVPQAAPRVQQMLAPQAEPQATAESYVQTASRELYEAPQPEAYLPDALPAAEMGSGVAPQASQYYQPQANVVPRRRARHSGRPLAFAPAYGASYNRMASVNQPVVSAATPVPAHVPGATSVMAPQHDHPQMPAYAWPSYAPHPNYGAVTYPKQYSPTVWPYIGPFYPYPQVPLGWRQVTLKWDDGWWFLDFDDRR